MTVCFVVSSVLSFADSFGSNWQQVRACVYYYHYYNFVSKLQKFMRVCRVYVVYMTLFRHNNFSGDRTMASGPMFRAGSERSPLLYNQ